MAISMDWTATILAAAETTAAEGYPLDGISLLPVMKGANPLHDRTFFWRIADQDAVRKGNWKYFRDGTERRLFDLSFDSHEQADFSSKNPEMLKQLVAEFEEWDQQMLPRIKR